MHPAAQRTSIHPELLFGSGRDRWPPAPVPASSPCFLQPKSSAGLSLLSVADVGHALVSAALLQPCGLRGAGRRRSCPRCLPGVSWLSLRPQRGLGLGHGAEGCRCAGLSPAWLAGARVSLCSPRGEGMPCFWAGRGGQGQGLAGDLAACFSWCTELGLLHVFGSS